MDNSRLFTSVLLVDNIHCPSCVSYAEDVLRPLLDVVNVTISIVSHEIRIKHHKVETASAAIHELGNAAFEIQHVTTTDVSGKVVTHHETSNNSQRPPLYTWPVFMSRAQRKHIENCKACRTKTANQPRKAKLWAAVRRRDTLIDVEKQDSLKTLVDGTAPKASDEELKKRPPEEETHVASLSIGGMTCASCISTITKALEGMDFVSNISINLMGNSGTVIFYGPKENIDKILESIEDAGYEASVDEINEIRSGDSSKPIPSRLMASLSIDGMTCGSCVGTITRGLEELPFVHEVDIDLVGNSGKVVFEGKENADKILEKIDDLGYDATIVELAPLDDVSSEPVTERTVTIAVEGMFCEHCPSNILEALDQGYGDSIVVEQPISLRDPKIRIRYTPSPPKVTIRSLVRTITNAHEAFSAKLWHAPSIEERSRAMQHREQRRILARLIFTFLVAIPTLIIGVVYMSLVPATNPTKMWFEEPVWVGNVSRTEWALFIMTTPVMCFGADVFHTRTFKELKALWRPGSRVPILRRFYRFGSMNMLISAGTSVAYFSSVAVLALDARAAPKHSMSSGSATYFDSVTFLSFFILIGKYLEAYSKAKTGDAVAMLSKLRPDEAILVEENSEAETQHVEVDLLEIGDKVKVLHGASPPTDGIVTSDGTFLFDESSLTGESKPVKKTAGDQIFAGSVNVSQQVTVKVASIGGTSMLDKIVAVVREGQTKRAPVERIADTITGYFVPVITLLAIITFVVWLALGQSGSLPKRYLGNEQGGWPFWSLEFAIAVFVVACPCGLGLAAPTALFVGGGLAAKHGILVRGGGEAFQEASRLDVIVFDKTGTLTEGQMKVTDFELLDGEKNETRALVLTLAKAMEESSTHPIAKAIVDYCAENGQGVTISDSDITEIPGQGMRGKFTGQDGQIYEAAIGNQRLLSTLQDSNAESTTNVYLETTLTKFQNLGQSTAILYLQQPDSASFQPSAVFAISDPIRPSAHTILNTLRGNHHLSVHMCTGDNPTTALAIASQLNIPPANVRAGVLPTDKAAYIHELQGQNDHQKARKVVAFVGDGTNDTPALTAADVSIALSSGSDIAVSTSSFILLNPDLNTLLTLVTLAKRVFNRVKYNFVWAGIYNVLLVPVAAGVFFKLGDLDGRGHGWRLGPVWASAAMALSSVSVVLSSLALRMPKIGSWFGRKGDRV
jgi:P-type Cu+ transporter